MIKIAVTLKTQEQLDKFFTLSGYERPTCGCAKSKWTAYGKETAYDVVKRELGNVRYYEALKYGIMSYDEFSKHWIKDVQITEQKTFQTL